MGLRWSAWLRSLPWTVMIIRLFPYLSPDSFSIDIMFLTFMGRRFNQRFDVFWFRINNSRQFNFVILGLGIHINSFSDPATRGLAMHEPLPIYFEIPGIGLLSKRRKPSEPDNLRLIRLIEERTR